MKAVDPKTPLEIVVTSNPAEVDVDALALLGERAFQQNYRGRIRPSFDADYVDWLLTGRSWVAVLALNEQREPIGCLLSLLRTLSQGGELFPAMYSTGWVVDPAYRRTGASLRIWAAIRATLRERDRLGIGAVHGGNSGTRGGVVFREDKPEDRRAGVILHHGALWSRALTGTAPAVRMRAHRLCFVDGGELYDDPDAPIDLETYSRLVASHASLTFAPTESFAQQYFNAEVARSGTLWFEPDAGARCAVGFSTFALALDAAEIGRVGRVQFVLSFGCDDAQVAAVLDETAGFLQRAGCSSVSIVDQHGIPHAVLERCGYVRTEDPVTISVGVPPALVPRLQGHVCSLDFV